MKVLLYRQARLACFAVAACLLISGPVTAQDQTQGQSSANPTAILHTSRGDIRLELFADRSPLSVENFIRYAEDGYYDGTIFHRVISHFMIQGGGFTEELEKKPTREPITNEANNGVSNQRGTIAMARTNDPHSATSQFFINVQDNINLNHVAKSDSRSWGYTAFGQVTEGMDVVDDIRFAQTSNRQGMGDVPNITIVIKSVEIIQPQ